MMFDKRYVKACILSLQFDEAYDYIMKYALEGDPEGYYHLGWFYLDGIGVEEDIKKAKYFLGIAANLGHKRAIMLLESMNQGDKNESIK